MKIMILIAGILCFSLPALAQKTLTGANTGGSFKLAVKQKQGVKKNDMPYADMDIDKILKEELFFNLSFNSGAPDFRDVNISGTALGKDGKTYLFTSIKNTDNPCVLQFTIKEGNILLKVLAGSADCGFSGDDKPEGTYVHYAN